MRITIEPDDDDAAVDEATSLANRVGAELVSESLRADDKPRMTIAQRDRLWTLCGNYNVPFREDDYFLRDGWVEGWIGGRDGSGHTGRKTIYVGCSPDGQSHS